MNATFKITGDYPWVGPGTVLQIHGYFEIGDSFINDLSRVFCNNRIKLGDNCVISWNIDILDYNFHELYIDGERSYPGPVVIGDNVWVRQGVTILPNVEIKDNAVIGAESVVTKDVLSGSLAVGNPVEIIETNIRWD
jgi:acetyltransferase-like isoleucine patch superfamily enzyme